MLINKKDTLNNNIRIVGIPDFNEDSFFDQEVSYAISLGEERMVYGGRRINILSVSQDEILVVVTGEPL